MSGMRLCLSQSEGLLAEMRRCPQGWDQVLSRRWSLAPADLVDKGEVNDENYELESDRIGEFAGKAILENLPGASLMMLLGIGKIREWRFFVQEANQQRVSLSACDWSKVANRNGTDFFADLPMRRGIWNRVRRVDVEVLFENLFSPMPKKNKTLAQRDLEEADLIYAGQFIQVLDDIGKNVVMRGLGKWLASREGRKVLLVHPFPEDNRDAVWGHTTPYSLQQLLVPAIAGAGRELEVLGLQNKGGFYRHVYTAFTLTAK